MSGCPKIEELYSNFFVTALDAYVLLELYDIMVATAAQNNLKVDLEPMISMKWLKPSQKEKRRARQRGIGKLKSPKRLVSTAMILN